MLHVRMDDRTTKQTSFDFAFFIYAFCNAHIVIDVKEPGYIIKEL